MDIERAAKAEPFSRAIYASIRNGAKKSDAPSIIRALAVVMACVHSTRSGWKYSTEHIESMADAIEASLENTKAPNDRPGSGPKDCVGCGNPIISCECFMRGVDHS